MRVLLDENVDRNLKRSFDPEHEVVTVHERAWSGKKNGELLRLAEAEFDVLVTLDKNMRHQQDLPRYDLAVILITARSNKRSALEPAMPDMNRLLLWPSLVASTMLRHNPHNQVLVKPGGFGRVSERLSCVPESLRKAHREARIREAPIRHRRTGARALQADAWVKPDLRGGTHRLHLVSVLPHHRPCRYRRRRRRVHPQRWGRKSGQDPRAGSRGESALG